MAGAAFFDLDRTLLAGGSGQILSRVMQELGVVSRGFPGEKYLYGIFDTLGENVPSILLARAATLVAKGRRVETFDEAAAQAAEIIAEKIPLFAHHLIAQHKAAGRPVVLATTTPMHLVKPLADRLGIDHVIATRYGAEDGRFDGTVYGPFVWSRGKLVAVRRYAEQNGIDLAESYAYSDSIYDLPLLSAVGNPAAVNPDPRLALYAVARRWPIVHFDVSPGVLKVPVVGVELQRLIQAVNLPELYPYVRFDIRGLRNIPRSGPAILVANHRSYFDAAAMAALLRRTGRTARGLGKAELFDVPFVGSFLTAVGGVRVDRGGDPAGAYDMAALALEGGELVALMPQGTIPRGEKFFDPELKGKTGAARLAAMTGAPVIPIGIWGTDEVWPRSAKLPDFTRVGDPVRVRIRVGEPVELKYRSPKADTRRIMAAIQAQLPRKARTRHTPTEAELAATYPGGRLPNRE